MNRRGRAGGAQRKTLLGLVAALVLLLPSPGAGAAAQVRDVGYRNGEVEITARLYLPPGEGPHPAVLFVHGRRGWGEQAEGQVQRIARHCFAVIAPDYHSPRFIPAWPESHDPATEKDVELALDFLKTVRAARADKVCVVGISRGGYHAILLAAKRKEVACVVTYYGHMVNPNAPEPWQVYRWAPEIERIAVPSLFIVGAEDFELRRMGIHRAFYNLLERGVHAELRVYPNARRAFDFRADQRPEERLATEDAASWTAQFLRRVLAP